MVERARRRLERGRSLDGPVTLTGARTEQRRRCPGCSGAPPGPGSTVTVSLPAVDGARVRVDEALVLDDLLGDLAADS